MAQEGNRNYYRIKKGESLFEIADGHNVSLEGLVAENELNDSSLFVQKQLVLPQESSKWVYLLEYPLEKGEYLYQLSRKFSVSVSELKLANPLEVETLKEGQPLLIPVTESSLAAVRLEVADSLQWWFEPVQAKKYPLVHEVFPGENLSDIAEMYALSEKVILGNNLPLKAHEITFGESILIGFSDSLGFVEQHPGWEQKELIATLMPGASKQLTAKFLALNNRVARGSYFKLINPTTRRTVWVKSMGAIPPLALYEGKDVVLSHAAAQALGLLNEVARVKGWLPVEQN